MACVLQGNSLISPHSYSIWPLCSRTAWPWSVPPGGGVRLSSQTVRKSTGITSQNPRGHVQQSSVMMQSPRRMGFFLIV